jgi:hypothetical protein
LLCKTYLKWGQIKNPTSNRLIPDQKFLWLCLNKQNQLQISLLWSIKSIQFNALKLIPMVLLLANRYLYLQLLSSFPDWSTWVLLFKKGKLTTLSEITDKFWMNLL